MTTFFFHENHEIHLTNHETKISDKNGPYAWVAQELHGPNTHKLPHMTRVRLRLGLGDMASRGRLWVSPLSPVERLAQPGSGHLLGERRGGHVPAKGVSLHDHALVGGPVHDLVAGTEIVHPLRGVRRWRRRG